jgi:2'-5' RNA ligase
MSDGAMIAYIPTDGSWCQQEFPHMTLVYAGLIADRQETDFNAMAKDAISAARVTRSFNLNVVGVEVFGEGFDSVDVLTFYPTPQLLLARKIVEKWNGSEFTDFKPHATIGPVGSATTILDPAPRYSEGYMKKSLPIQMYFNRIAVAWGDRKLIFNMDDLY